MVSENPGPDAPRCGERSQLEELEEVARAWEAQMRVQASASGRTPRALDGCRVPTWLLAALLWGSVARRPLPALLARGLSLCASIGKARERWDVERG